MTVRWLLEKAYLIQWLALACSICQEVLKEGTSGNDRRPSSCLRAGKSPSCTVKGRPAVCAPGKLKQTRSMKTVDLDSEEERCKGGIEWVLGTDAQLLSHSLK